MTDRGTRSFPVGRSCLETEGFWTLFGTAYEQASSSRADRVSIPPVISEPSKALPRRKQITTGVSHYGVFAQLAVASQRAVKVSPFTERVLSRNCRCLIVAWMCTVFVHVA